MTTATANPTRKPARSKNRVLRLAGPYLRIVEGVKVKHVHRYELEALASDFGRAFRFHKLEAVFEGGKPVAVEEGRVYDVNVDTSDPEHGRHTCECDGFLRWHTCCKHIAAVLKLHELGQLPEAPASAPTAPGIAPDDPFTRLPAA